MMRHTLALLTITFLCAFTGDGSCLVKKFMEPDYQTDAGAAGLICICPICGTPSITPLNEVPYHETPGTNQGCRGSYKPCAN